MRIERLRIVGIRCFEDSGNIDLAPRINIFVGKNNAGKSTLLKAILGLQGFPFDASLDTRPPTGRTSFVKTVIADIRPSPKINYGLSSAPETTVLMIYMGDPADAGEIDGHRLNSTSTPLFPNVRPNYSIVPFLARRKAASFSHDVSLNAQSNISGTLAALYGRIDSVATSGHPRHEIFCEAVKNIVGLDVTTKASSGGKEAGFYFDEENFVTLERMGDGVTEMVGLIVELCSEKEKIFVLEEPETNLHPSGLKLLLAMIRDSASENQFFIATHSNVVVRELGCIDGAKVFRVFRDGKERTRPSKVEEVEKTPAAHMDLLRELGYEFTDFNLYDGWLFLEESSAESVIRDVLIPYFVPELRGRLRTYSAGGAANLGPSVSEFLRLIVFIHLQQPAYEGRLWVRADGDEAGNVAIAKIREKFGQLSHEALNTFARTQFELYYPDVFDAEIKNLLTIQDKQAVRIAKRDLLQRVLKWSGANEVLAREAWKRSAQEPIDLLKSIKAKLTG